MTNEKTTKIPCWSHKYKLISCDGVTDIYKCTECDTKLHESCSFDEDFS